MIKKNDIRKITRVTPYDKDGYKFTFLESKEEMYDDQRKRTCVMSFSIRVPGFRNDIRPGDYVFVGRIVGLDLKPYWYKISPTTEMFATSICLFVEDVTLLTKDQVEQIKNKGLKEVIKDNKLKSGKEQETELSKQVSKKEVPPNLLPF